MPLVRWHVLRRQAAVATLTGRFDASRQHAGQAAEIAADWDDPSVRFTRFAQSLQLALLRGDPDELTPGWTDYLDHVEELPPVAHAVLASALLVDGRPQQAPALGRPLIRQVAPHGTH